MTKKVLGSLCLLAATAGPMGCATMNENAVAEAKDAPKPKDNEPRGFFRELWNSGYLPNGKSPSQSLYP